MDLPKSEDAGRGPRLAAGLNTNWLSWDTLIAVGALLALAATGVAGSRYPETMVEVTIVYAIAGMSLSFLIRGGGFAVAGHAAMLGIGAYMTAVVGSALGGAYWLAIPAGLASGALYAVTVGALINAVRGRWAILTSFVAAAIVMVIALLSFDAIGILLPRIGFRPYKLWLWLVCLAATYLVLRLSERRLAPSAIRGTTADQRTNTSGMTYLSRMLLFAISGAACGLAGALYASTVGFVAPQMMFRMSDSTVYLGLALVGSVRFLSAPIVAAAIFIALRETAAFYGLGFGTQDSLLGWAFVVIGLAVNANRFGLSRAKFRANAGGDAVNSG